MSNIQRLDPHLSNMIAAGEVVERPVGVIKELIENAIDAQATHIDIETKQGGIEQMMIVDDGIGMSRADAELAFERHATSKIKNVQDLWRISTMGFRGEALPSIASVSAVQLNTNNKEEATSVQIEYGKIIKISSVGTPNGTQIIVKNLFQKTPARFKHLKSAQYEYSLISDVVSKFALAYPNIAFSLSNDGKKTFMSNGNGNIQEVIMNIYGREIAKSMVIMEGKDVDYTLQLQVAQPEHTRATKYYMLVFVNNRMVRNPKLQKAIQEAYKAYIPSDRYPIAIVHIYMDPQLVDVNVHPSKWEIRLSKEKQLEQLITQTIQKALQDKLEVNKIVRQPKPVVGTPTFSFTYENSQAVDIHQAVNESFAQYQVEKPVTNIIEVDDTENSQDEATMLATVIEQMQEEIQENKKEEVANHPSFPYMYVIGQLHKSYILAQSENGLYIIDQHAAQERYHFEQVQEAMLKGSSEYQTLLVPITIEVSSKIMLQLDTINTHLESIGIYLETFGDTTLVVRRLPLWLKQVEEKQFIQDMLDLFIKHETVSLEDLRKHAMASIACHSSIRFNRDLNLEEMKQVVQDLRTCKQPFHCPHGRPTFIELTLKELEKDFLRVK